MFRCARRVARLARPAGVGARRPLSSAPIAGLDDVVIVTTAAAKRIGSLTADGGAPARLRLAIDGGGCSGFEYKFEVEPAGAPTDADDHVFSRDGRDVVVSYTFHHLRAGEAHHFPAHLRESFTRHQRAFRDNPDAIGPDDPGLLAVEAWVRETARFWGWRVLEDIRHGAGTDTPTLLSVRYEDLHADVAAQCRRMYDFLGLDPAQATPPDHDARTAPGFDRDDGTTEDRRSLYRKGAVGDWQRFATPEFVRWMREEAGEALERLGYGW